MLLTQNTGIVAVDIRTAEDLRRLRPCASSLPPQTLLKRSDLHLLGLRTRGSPWTRIPVLERTWIDQDIGASCCMPSHVLRLVDSFKRRSVIDNSAREEKYFVDQRLDRTGGRRKSPFAQKSMECCRFRQARSKPGRPELAIVYSRPNDR